MQIRHNKIAVFLKLLLFMISSIPSMDKTQCFKPCLTGPDPVPPDYEARNLGVKILVTECGLNLDFSLANVMGINQGAPE
jgi:hypothetical protein